MQFKLLFLATVLIANVAANKAFAYSRSGCRVKQNPALSLGLSKQSIDYLQDYTMDAGVDGGVGEEPSFFMTDTVATADGGPDEISPENAAEARRALAAWFGNDRGTTALDRMVAFGDRNGDEKFNSDELQAYLSEIGLGNRITRPYWRDGIMEAFGSGSPKTISREDGQFMLQFLGLW